MRTQPIDLLKSKSKSTSNPPKTHYQVNIDGTIYSTHAHSESAAISNAAFHYAEDHNTEVGLVMWMINTTGELSVKVEEL